MSVALRTILVLAVLSLLLIGMIAKKQYTLNTGTPILLQTQPVDPRSLFRGDYVILNYVINTLHPQDLSGDDAFERNTPVYVVLERGDTYWQPTAVHTGRPEPGEGQVIIRGRVQYRSTWQANPGTASGEGRTSISVNYGIEHYFVPEGEGRELERPSADNRVDLRIVVDRFGNAAIKGILVNGEERYTETLL